MSTRPRFVGGLLGRRPKGVTVAASARANPADADSFDVHSGIAVVKILPRNHVEYEPVTRWVEVAAGANEIVVPLIRSAAVVVEVASTPAFAAKAERTFSSMATEGTTIPIVRLVRDGIDFTALVLTDGSERDPFRQRYRFGPLDPGRYTLIVPTEAGFERPGESEVEVVAHEVTKIELRVDGKDLPLREGGR
jgi:hypothetical protein